MKNNTSPFSDYVNVHGLDDIIALHDLALQELKAIELESQSVHLPALNQLGYSLTHFLNAISNSKSEEEVKNELEKAKNHIKRCLYDAVEYQILDYLESIIKFKNDFRNINIAEFIPDYHLTMKKVEKIKNDLKFYTFSSDKRDLHFEQIKKSQTILKEITNQLESTRPVLIDAVQGNRSKAFSITRNLLLLVLSLLGVIIAFLAKV